MLASFLAMQLNAFPLPLPQRRFAQTIPELSMLPLPSLEYLPPDLVSSSSPIDASMHVSSLITTGSTIWGKIQSETDPYQYLFMLPTVALVSTCCQLAGIGGAAVMSPIFLLVFPLLGPSYPLPTAASAIASALLTEVFGFASGLLGYSRRGLVDWSIAAQFSVVSVPSALIGAILAASVAQNPSLLRGVYAALMIGLATYLTVSDKPEAILEEECEIPEEGDDLRKHSTADGTEFLYFPPKQGDLKSASATIAGSGLTGLLGVGVGEVILPQLVRSCCMPLPVAAGTSVAVVVVTALTAAIVQFLTLASMLPSEEGTLSSLVSVVPWNLVQFTIPGALIGGQIAPYLANRQIFSDEFIERFAATLFGVIGIAFGVKYITG